MFKKINIKGPFYSPITDFLSKNSVVLFALTSTQNTGRRFPLLCFGPNYSLEDALLRIAVDKTQMHFPRLAIYLKWKCTLKNSLYKALWPQFICIRSLHASDKLTAWFSPWLFELSNVDIHHRKSLLQIKEELTKTHTCTYRDNSLFLI